MSNIFWLPQNLSLENIFFQPDLSFFFFFCTLTDHMLANFGKVCSQQVDKHFLGTCSLKFPTCWAPDFFFLSSSCGRDGLLITNVLWHCIDRMTSDIKWTQWAWSCTECHINWIMATGTLSFLEICEVKKHFPHYGVRDTIKLCQVPEKLRYCVQFVKHTFADDGDEGNQRAFNDIQVLFIVFLSSNKTTLFWMKLWSKISSL